MATLFLIVIYAAFISLGLPDGLLGVAWPIMQPQFAVSLGSAGIVSMVVSGCTIISSLMSGRMTKKLGTGLLTLISVILTAIALFGYSLAPGFLWLIVLAIPLGLGAGSVDAALNAYVAANYESHHMSWLHSFWGVGAMLGPVIMSRTISLNDSWRQGYLIVSICQAALILLLAVTLPIWNRVASARRESEQQFDHAGAKTPDGNNDLILNRPEDDISADQPDNLTIFGATKIRGVKLAMATFFFYCGIETTLGLWGSTYLIQDRGFEPARAAALVSIYYGSITAGRFISGFLTMRMSNRRLIRIGELIILVGVIVMLLPLPSVFAPISFFLIGFGCAPVFPCMIHETPAHFGRKHAPFIMGLQMASAYTGITLLPPLLGQVANAWSIVLLPFFLLAYISAMLASSEKIAQMMRARKRAN
jgi:fucose permease